MKSRLVILLLLLAFVVPQASAQRRHRGYLYQEWVVENGDSIPMGTKVDGLTYLSHIDNEEELVEQGKMSKEAIENRRLLRRVMREAGFLTIRTEWWHFNFTTRSDAKANYKLVK